MADRVEIEVRLKITLATETFSGKDHSGASSTAYMINHPVTIFAEGDSDTMKWMQHRDRSGNFDDRLPGHGLASMNQGECRLMDGNGAVIIALSGFTAPMSSDVGIAEYKHHKNKYGEQKNSQIHWVGKGVWELVSDSSSAPEPRYLTSAWKFNTSSSTSIGGLVVEFGQGTLVFDDPSKITRRFAYLGGGGSVDLGKALKLIKALKDAVWAAKVMQATSAVKVSGGSSTEDMFSTGTILKNVLTVGGRELTQDDFTGPCVWLDASIGIYKSLGGMILLTHFDTDYNIPKFRACIPCVGVNYMPVSAGAGACLGVISRA